MEPLKIAEKLKQKFPDDIISTASFRGQVSVFIKKESVVDICNFLKGDIDLAFDYLKDITAIDYMDVKDIRFEVVYNLYSIKHKHFIRIKAPVSESDCAIDTVVPVWSGANWLERECFDLFGIKFNDHPDLRRILLPDDWEGHPLRKDYPVKGPDAEDEWAGYKQVLADAKRLKEFEWDA